MFLLRECQSNSSKDNREYLEAIEAGLVLLDAVESHNLLARHATRVLRKNMSETDL
jgi:hypothetical protein